MPTPQVGNTVRVWIWPSDFEDLFRGSERLRTAIVHQEQRAQNLIPVEIRVVEPETVVQEIKVPELKFPEPQKEPGEPPLHRARKRYHAVFANLIQNPWERDDTRHAFHAAHQALPNDERHFHLEHYQLATEELEARGPTLLLKALKVAARQDPADLRDIEALEGLLDGSNPEANATKRGRWVVGLEVGEWVRRELGYQETLAA